MRSEDPKPDWVDAEGQDLRSIRVFTAGVMISLAIVAWLATYWYMNSMNMGSHVMTGMGSNLIKMDSMKMMISNIMTRMRPSLPVMTMSAFFSSLEAALIADFIVLWTVSMVAMMFPAMIPIALMEVGYLMKSGHNKAIGLVSFLGGYLLIYAILGLGAYFAIFSGFYLAEFAPALTDFAVPVSAAILFATGVWQLTSLKDKCLANCVSPMAFFLTHMKKGLTGSFRMGAEHGYYCAGCCAMYMLVMAAVAGMSIQSMIILTIVMTIEKAIVKGAEWFRWISALGFVAFAIGLLLWPHVFGFA